MLTKLGLFPEGASTMAGRVDALYFALVAIAVFFTGLIAILIAVFAIRYRRRAGQEAEQIHGSLALELAWSVIPLIVAMGIFVWGASVFVSIKRPPDDALQVYAVGKQWMWKIQHLEGRREINELHVPVGRPVKITLTSEDVIHSFYIPAFRVKQDAVPGRYTTLWFEANQVGSFHLFCAEYCGTEHSRMIGRVVVMDPADYQDWLRSGASETATAGTGEANGTPGTLVGRGEQLYATLGCGTCHSGTSGALGPALAGLYGRSVDLKGGEAVVADELYLRESIVSPQAKLVAGYQPIMPTFQGQVNEEALVELIAYIKSLGTGRPVENTPGGNGARGS